MSFSEFLSCKMSQSLIYHCALRIFNRPLKQWLNSERISQRFTVLLTDFKQGFLFNSQWSKTEMVVFFTFLTSISLHVNKLNQKHLRKENFLYDLAIHLWKFMLKLKLFIIFKILYLSLAWTNICKILIIMDSVM